MVAASRILALLLAAAALLLPAAPADARPGDCAGAGPRTARDLALVLPDGTRLDVRDPYGGVLPASRRTFRFGVHGAADELERAGTIRWYLDDRRVARSAAPPFTWAGRTAALAVGRHTVTVQAEPRDGVIATTSFSLRVSGCR